MTIAAAAPGRAPHPVALDIEYPERLSRVKTAFRLILAIPQLFVVYLLFVALSVLTLIAWFAILFTGRYPKSFFPFCAGVLRWQANVAAYVGLFRDEYPPWGWEPGEYPVSLEIPRADRQSRFRLFIRWSAIIPNQLVFFFVSIAWGFTTFLSWFAIIFTGRYPRGFFKFGAGAMRWMQRSNAYVYLLRDEYPPYSINASARPGNEVVSAIVGLPLYVAYIAIWLLPFAGVLRGGESRVDVGASALTTPALLRQMQPSGEANNVRITLLDYSDNVAPIPAKVELPPGYRLLSFQIDAKKDGFLPAFFAPFLFFVKDCGGERYGIDADATVHKGFTFELYWHRGHNAGTVYFQVPRGERVCELEYFAGVRRIRFRFQ